MKNAEEGQVTNKDRRRRSFRSWALVLLVAMATILIVLLGIQTLVNQNWGTQKLADQLSKSLNTEVQIQNIQLNIFKGVRAEGVLIKDYRQDTLIYVQTLTAGLQDAISSAFQKKLILNNAMLDHGLLNLVTYSGDDRKNLAVTFNPNPSTEVDTTAKEGLPIELGTVTLMDFEFRNHDFNRGSEEFYRIGNADVEVNHMNFANDSIALGDVCFDQTSIRIHMFTPEGTDTTMTMDQINEAIDTARQRSPFFMSAERLTLSNSRFQLDNDFRAPNWNQNYDRINYDHFLLKDVNISVDNFKIHDLAFAGKNLMLSFESPSGFTLDHLKVDDAIVDSTQAVLNGVNLLTPSSSLGDTISFKFNCFEAWRDFNNNVFIDARLRNSLLSFRDIMHFAPALYDNTFFINSEKEIMEIDGRLVGRVNSLKAYDLFLNVGSDISFRGDISTRNLTIRDEEVLGLNIEDLRFDVLSLENIVPGLDIPSNFEKLGLIRFKGRFDGYFQDFVTYGNLSSNLGSARMDMRLDLKPGKVNARYSGKMSLNDFDLSRWMENQDFGLLSMAMQVEEGRGLVLESANAKVDGVVNKLEFKEYAYENLKIDAQLTKNLFDGVLIADSEDAKLTFNGKISNLDSIPNYNFLADIDHVRLKSLNITKREFDFGGKADISLRGLNWDELIGEAVLKNNWVVFDGQDTMQLLNTDIEQLNVASGRNLQMSSNFGTVEIKGVYDIPKIHQDFINIVGNNHEQLAELLGIDSLVTESNGRKDYSINIDLNEKFELLDYFTNEQYRLGEFSLDAFVNTTSNSIKYQSTSASFGVGNWDIGQTELSLVNDGPLMVYTLNSDRMAINGQPWFDSLYHIANLKGDSGTFKLSYIDPQNIFESVEIDAKMLPLAKQLQIEFNPSALWFGKNKWTFEADNSLLIRKKGLIFNNFKLAADSAYLVLDDLNEGRGISATMENFSADILDSLTNLKAFDFKGTFDASLTIDDLFDFKGIDFSLWQDEMLINDKKRGGLTVSASGKSINKGIDINLDLTDDDSSLSADGVLARSSDSSDVNYQFDIVTDNLPLEILEDIITTGISGTKGGATGELSLEGAGNRFFLNGDLLIPQGQSTIDYIGVTYFFDEQTIKFEDDFINFNGTQFTDSLGNIASIRGGLLHESFKNWALDLTIESPKLIGLNTNKYDNPSYYGFALGEVKIDFYGSMERPNIDVVATTAAPSEMVIPITYGSSDIQTGFVEFVKIDTTTVDTLRQRAGDLTGLELDMKLTVTESAKTKIIFDEQAGDILQGYGRGNINVQMRRTGEMFVYGDYEIEEGDYLFTLLNFVNKPFIVKRGGTIRWTGDPIDAQINIEAEYKGLTASPYPLIQEYLAGTNSTLESEASRSTRVDLTMGLSGSLLSPRITFDIDLPNLVGELNTYVENKLQTLENDEERLNQQVFGLVVFGSFLPSNQSTALVNNLGASTINTLSEFLSTQLSVLFSSLLTDVVDDVKFISGIDVDLAYVQQQFELQSDQQSNFRDGEYQFRVKNRLWNDRWVITLGGDYGNQSLFNSDPYFNPETVIEWNTPVNGLKLRIYYRAEQNFQGQSQKVGGGIRYRKEFDDFMKFKEEIRKLDKEDS